MLEDHAVQFVNQAPIIASAVPIRPEPASEFIPDGPIAYPPSFSLTDLIQAERAAWEQLIVACRNTDEIELGRDPTDEEEAECEAANDAQRGAFDRVLAHTPQSAADIVAVMDLFEEREGRNIQPLFGGMISSLFASARVFLDPDHCFAEPDPVDLLWASWHDRVLRADQPTAHEGNTEDREFQEIAAVERQMRRLPPSVMRAGAMALVELYHACDLNHDPDVTPASLAASLWGDVTLLTLEGVRGSLRGAVRRCADDLLDNPDVPLGESALRRRPTAPIQFLQAAE